MAAIVTAAARATSPALETPDRTARRAADRTRAASRPARPAVIGRVCPRELSATCPLSLAAGGKPSSVRPKSVHRRDEAPAGSAGYGTQVGSCGRCDGHGHGPSVPSMDTLVQLTDVSKRYDSDGSPAVAHVSMEVARGESVAIMGPSGSGKSTLLNLIAGLDRPSSGAITVGGERVDTLSETGAARYRRRQVGMIFQFFNLLDDMTVIDNVLLPAQLAGIPARQARGRAGELLAALRIGQHKDAYPARLSGGERQRVAIGRALVNRPALLLADEPTGALDTATGEAIGELLLDLNSSGQTLILVTHNPDLSARYARRVIEIVDGRIAGDAHVTGAHR